MTRRLALAIGLLGALTAQAGSLTILAQGTAPTIPSAATRAIRRDLPMTNAIRAAFEAGTRDASGKPGPNYWQLEADYTINVSLDPARHTLTGTETIVLHNNSPSELTQILLRLDHNIFRGLVPRGMSTPAENTDGMVVTKIAVNGTAIDLAAPPAGGGRAGGRGGAPAGPRTMSVTGLTQTLASINLATPVAAKSTATLEIAWRTKLPGGPDGAGHRMTQRFGDELFQPTQWFPRVAKFDDLRGWDRQLYLGPAEFYNNFGKFDVTINVPAGWLVSGTGVLQNPKDVLTDKAIERLSKVLDSDALTTIVGDDEVGAGQATKGGAPRLSWRFTADKVNDFAWLTGKKLTWKATRATIPGPTPKRVPIHMLYMPERAQLFNNADKIARHALEYYSKLWAPYPFPQLTMQDGPSAGMEYPMVVNSNSGAADHEIAHQWWPMMVGNNETWYGWMDEGFNQYMNILSDADFAGQKANLDGHGQRYGRTSGDEAEPPLMWAANHGGPMYGFQTYSKTPLMLSMLGGVVGDAEVQRAMSEYTHAWAWKHPSPWDYANFMSNSLKKDLGWFWYYWLWTTESVEGSIEGATTAAGKTTVTVRQDGQMPSPVVLKVTFKDKTEQTFTFPVDVWFNGSKTYKAVLDLKGKAFDKIQLDPAGRFPDRNTADNAWPR
jgi:hypothetical protein